MVGGITVASGGRGAERIGDLLSLQGRAKRDPEGYEGELLLQLRHFDACLGIFLLQPTTSTSGNAASAAAADPGASKELADMAMFLAHMTPLYPQHLGKFPQQLLQLLASHGATLQPALCRQLTQAVILLRNRKVAVRLTPWRQYLRLFWSSVLCMKQRYRSSGIVCHLQMISLVDAVPVLMALQCRGDRVLRRLCFLHIIQDIRRMNLKNKNEPSNKPLQTILYNLLQVPIPHACRNYRMQWGNVKGTFLWIEQSIAAIAPASLSLLLVLDAIVEDICYFMLICIYYWFSWFKTVLVSCVCMLIGITECNRNL